jgi:formylglycine-generating enzyme required for sulfatase activity
MVAQKSCKDILTVALVLLIARGVASESNKPFKNQIGMKMVPVPAGSFRMGALNPTPLNLGGPALLPHGDYDEKPVHNVKLRRSFYISSLEVTAEQFRLFRPEYKGKGPLATNVSWYDAMAFCDWLSDKQGRPYRIPTEAEWEYACRAQTRSLFSSGQQPPDASTPNTWGIKGMHTGQPEWCLDWHGLYGYEDQTDPVGPDGGFVRVVRGGHIFRTAGQGVEPNAPYYFRSANRGGMEPTQPLASFRVVQGEMPKSEPTPRNVPFIQQCIHQDNSVALHAPDPKKPHFRVRPILPIPPENEQSEDVIAAVGLAPGLLGHNHAPALVAFANGDLLAVYWCASTSSKEYWPNVAFAGTRLRFGSDTWDMPEVILDIPDVREGGSFAWNDKGTVHLFTGGVGLDGVPFKWCSSTDNGATWTELKFPVITGPVGPYMGQPNGNGFRDNRGNMYVPTDGVGRHSLLWASHNNGLTWFDTGGRTHGRHTTFALLKDGSILGMGGKKTDIDGYMPKSISFDGGRTWEKSKTPFPALSSNQRPTITRLASGRLFFGADFQEKSKGKQPPEIKQRGSLVALSDDEGRTWHIKKLPGSLPHESTTFPEAKQRSWSRAGHPYATIGYSIATQAPNGIIHLITSMNHPNQHFEMNEAWILSGAGPKTETSVKGMIRNYHKQYDDGKPKAVWQAVFATDGSYLLHGRETWYYNNGQIQWEVTYNGGRKIGTETYYSHNGRIEWQWQHNSDGTDTWTKWYANGKKKSESSWRNMRCWGTAKTWDYSGNKFSEIEFRNGLPVE